MYDLFDILKRKIQPLYPEMGGGFSPMPDQHGQILAENQGLAMGGPGSAWGEGIGQLASQAGQMYAQRRVPEDQPLEAEKTPLNTTKDLTPRPFEQMPMEPFKGYQGMLPPAAGNPAIPFGRTRSNTDWTPFGGMRAHGGYVDPYKKYIVGENGPEEFVPEQPGTIVPNDHLQADQQKLGTQADVTRRQPEAMPQQGAAAMDAPQQAPVPPLIQALSKRQQLEGEIAKIQGKDYSIKTLPDGTKVRGKDRDDDHNILDILKGIGLGALQGAAQGGLPGLVGGAATGGIMAGVDRNYDEKVMDRFKTGQLNEELGVIREGEMADAKVNEQKGKAANQQRELAEGQYKSAEAAAKADGVIDENEAVLLNTLRKRVGLIGEVQKRDEREFDTIVDDQGRTVAVPKKGFPKGEVTDLPVQGGKVRTPRNIGGQDVTLSPSELVSLEVGNAAREQQAETGNVQRDVDVQKTNIANEMKYQDDVRTVITKTAEANADIIGGNAEVQSANQRVQVAREAVEAAANANDQDGVDKARKEFDSAVADFGKALGKVQGGSKLAAELKKAMPKRPAKVSAPKVKAQTVGKPVPKSKDPAGLFR